MGWATRWLLNLLGGNNKAKRESKHHSGYGGEEIEKKRWSFWKSRNSGEVALNENPSTAAAIEVAWFKSFYAGSEREQSKHAVAVAAAADAAPATARAARFPSQRRLYSAPERRAAVKIQTAFRGHLARKAFRALKALVKIQALVRGFLVRKQAADALHSMQALIRAQATVRAQRYRNLLLLDASFQPEVRHRRSFERLSDTRSERMAAFQRQRLSANLDRNPKIIEIDTCRPKSRSSRRTSTPFALDAADDVPPQAFSSSPVRFRVPARIAVLGRRNSSGENEYWCVSGDKCRLPATAQATPRCMSSSSSAAVTPARSLSGSSSPNYMANTQSSKAKLRSQGTRKRQPLSEFNMQKPCFQSQEGLSNKRGVVGRLDRYSEMGKKTESEIYLQRIW
ncbi:protein IQ-DOMAIN 14 [Canna indica]|uniref:Protein IQ-DOMAIN 14 n=1 Tax=Canna indica TaxID=4628 RepID=A0AAQ3KG45_9LILI|nr:protein IQ-DOMAIN 14 [Canna indica]